MDSLNQLQPSAVWQYFREIAAIPRPSKKEEKIIAYLIEFAREHHLEYKKDHIGNVLIRKPASESKKTSSVIVLQSHVDMVCEKNSGTKHNFLTDPIIPHIDGDWVKAKETTLGADDGIGVASMLAILADRTLEHGPLECLFTVDEESGLTGAFELSCGFFEGKTLINLDSEDEGELFIGCAGGIDTFAAFINTTIRVFDSFNSYLIGITGLQGGHSGDEIHLNRGNAVKIMADFLYNAKTRFAANIHRFEGGNLKNAIPREAFASVLLLPDKDSDFFDFYTEYFASVRELYLDAEPSLTFSIDKISTPDTQLKDDVAEKLLRALNDCPHGVISWSREIEGLVQTSTNLAAVKFRENNDILVITSQRSSKEEEKKEIADRIAAVFENAGAEVKQSNGYPGWTPNLNSHILNITKIAYTDLFGSEPKVKAIHAGLECGLFLEKYPGLDMISFGPTIKGAHSPAERLNIPSVEKFWKLLVRVLKEA